MSPGPWGALSPPSFVGSRERLDPLPSTVSTAGQWLPPLRPGVPVISHSTVESVILQDQETPGPRAGARKQRLRGHAAHSRRHGSLPPRSLPRCRCPSLEREHSRTRQVCSEGLQAAALDQVSPFSGCKQTPWGAPGSHPEVSAEAVPDGRWGPGPAVWPGCWLAASGRGVAGPTTTPGVCRVRM